MTRVVRNNKTGSYVNVDTILNEAFEYEDVKCATIFNPDIDEMTDDDIIGYVTNAYCGDTSIDLEIVNVKIRVTVLSDSNES